MSSSSPAARFRWLIVRGGASGVDFPRMDVSYIPRSQCKKISLFLLGLRMEGFDRIPAYGRLVSVFLFSVVWSLVSHVREAWSCQRYAIISISASQSDSSTSSASCQTTPNIIWPWIFRKRHRLRRSPCNSDVVSSRLSPHQAMSDMSGSDSMTSSNSSSSTSAMMMMIPYLHFTRGDYLLFEAWQPMSAGAIAGACIGLVALAIFERWLSATRVVFNVHWRRRAYEMTAARDQIVATKELQADRSPHVSIDNVDLLEKAVQEVHGGATTTNPTQQPKSVLVKPLTRTITPFIPAHDIPRGLLYSVQMLVMYILMLAVMTFQAAFFISIVVGLGIGETLFGRVTALGAGRF